MYRKQLESTFCWKISGELKLFKYRVLRMEKEEIFGQAYRIDYILRINNILIEVLASMAEQERKLIRKRQREGIETAKKKGKHLGRPKLQMPEQFPEVYERWKSGELTAKTAMKMLGMASTSFYRMVSRYEENIVPKGGQL